MSKIAEITPIKDGMSKEEAREATQVFLSELLRNHRQINLNDIYSEQGLSAADRKFKLITTVDGSLWVEGASGGIQRFIGADYLSKQLNNLRIDQKANWYTPKAAFCLKEYKQSIKCTINFHEGMKALVVESEDFVSYSQYVGKKGFISTGESIDKLADNPEGIDIIEEETGWVAYDCFSNFRVVKEKNDDGTNIIKQMLIDTEYNSFKYKGEEALFSAETIELLGGQTLNLQY